MLQDAHIHLQNIKDPQLTQDILKMAATSNLGRIFYNSASIDDWPIVAKVADEFNNVYPFFGIHPWHANNLPQKWEVELLTRLDTEPSGIGEIGLDCSGKGADLEIQKQVFDCQLDIAIETKKPFVLHSVDSWELVIDKLRWHRPGRLNFMIHAFSGTKEILRELLVLGAFISFSLETLKEQDDKIKKIFPFVPLDRLLLETNFPKQGSRGGSRTAPTENIKASAKEYFDSIEELYNLAASAKGVTKSELEEVVWANGAVFMR